MFPNERLQRICDLVNERGAVRVAELSRLLDVSEVTVRRDLEQLSKERRLQRTHGGAISMHPVGAEISAPELIRSQKNVEEKRLIARFAYEMINDKDTIFMDGSSTVNELAKIIAREDDKRLYIITPSLTVVSALANCSNVTVIMPGGEVSYLHGRVEGTLATEAIHSMRADRCFIGINGIDQSFGFSLPRLIEIDLKCAMMKASRQSIVLADHSKFGKVYMARLRENCDYVVTDTRLKDYDYDWLKEESAVLFADERLNGLNKE
ncbi:MAG: DeoR/GlpR transcriptional regulator [Clostridia bacterium]|nr:DeoR/GlpR transcriptional regulator [Clostridia bacterium]